MIFTLAGCADGQFNTQLDASTDAAAVSDAGATDAPTRDGELGDGALPPGTIRCGAATCRPPKEACCLPGQTKGTVCCLNSANGRFTTTECVATANCDFTGPHDILCDSALNTCPAAASKCAAATFNTVSFDAFGICQ